MHIVIVHTRCSFGMWRLIGSEFDTVWRVNRGSSTCPRAFCLLSSRYLPVSVCCMFIAPIFKHAIVAKSDLFEFTIDLRLKQ